MSILAVRNLTKVYPGTVALDDVTMRFESGKVNAIIGKNGSGKSTLIKSIAGALVPTSGGLYLDDQKLEFSNPTDAYKSGISTVYQELSLVNSLDIAENIYMGRLKKKGLMIDWKTTYAMAEELLKSMSIDLSPKTIVSELSMWQRQMIEIVKAMSFEPKVIMLDEPTSALAQNEAELLFSFINQIKQKDVNVLYISHRLHELWKIADTCTVIRDGKYIGKIDMKDATHKIIIDMMFGEVEIRSRPSDIMAGEETALEVKNLTRKGKFKDVSFTLKKGEILGIAGMLGAGRTELLKSIFGADPMDSGSIYIKGTLVKSPNPQKMKHLGLAMTQEDRKQTGLVQVLCVKDNLSMASLDKLSKGGIVNTVEQNRVVEKQIDELAIKISSKNEFVSSLSGGNQQKVVVGNWLNTQPDIIFFDEPSRGIDVNAKQQIFQIIWEQSRKGISSVMVSSELEELIEVCQRILIMKEGKILEEVNAEDVTIEQLYSKCMGEEK